MRHLLQPSILILIIMLAPAIPARGAPLQAAAEKAAAGQAMTVQEYLGERGSRMAARLAALPNTVEAWEKRRDEVRRQLTASLGLPRREPMRARVIRTWEEGGLVFEDLDYLWAEGTYATAQIVRPKSAAGRLPAIVSPPGWIGFLDQDFYRSWVRHMAGQGYLVMFVDDPRVRRRTAPYAGFYAVASAAGTQAMGVQVFDNLRALDYLLTRPDVDPGRIGISGLCQGSEQTWLAAALEDRFHVVSPVCGTTTYEWWVRMPHFIHRNLSDPSPYVENILRWTDWHELGACIAPRPVLIASNSGDDWFPKPGFDKVVATLRGAYGLYGKPEEFEVVFDLRSHSMTPYTKEICAWFDKHLKPLRPSDAKPLPCGEAVHPDTSMIRYFQRRIASQTGKLPAAFGSKDDWEAYRKEIVAWLRQACAVAELEHGPAVVLARETQQGRVVETVLLPQDEGFFCPTVVYSPSGDHRKRPAMIISHHSSGCARDKNLQDLAAAMAGDGWLVMVPEHASNRPESLRRVKSLISLYGAGDAVGLPPLAMRVWDDLSCVEYLAGRQDVDPNNICIAGLGEGGIDVAITAALDDRVAAAAAVGATTVRDWADQVAPRAGEYDRIMPYLPGITTKTDFQFIYPAVAPRPLLLVELPDQADWPAAAYQRVRKQAEHVYGLYGPAAELTFSSAKSPWGLEELRGWARDRAAPALAPKPPAATCEPLFTRKEVAAYQPKGPTRCFRQISFEYNSTSRYDYSRGRFGKPEEMIQDFSQADPVRYAEFCKRINIDSVVLLAVPEGGYTTYLQTTVGQPFPYLKQNHFDFFGQTIRQCHDRGVSVFGYICIGWTKRHQQEFPEDFPHPGEGAIPSLNGRYADRVLEYAREILTHYPVDGLRTDILDHNTAARTPGDKAFYRALYSAELPEKFPDWQREQHFRLASISRFVRRFHEACKAVKPNVEIWHNWFNDRNVVDLRDTGVVDIAYEEFADPFSTLFVRGIFAAPAMISGKLLQNPQRRLCLVLGGRAYDYFPVNKKTALPDQPLLDWFHRTGGYYGSGYRPKIPPDMTWFDRDLAPFYSMVAQVEPYLVGTRPVADVAAVFSEASRFRFPGWNRQPVVEPLKKLTDHYLQQNRPLEFLSSFHLPKHADLRPFKLLLVADMTGLKAEESQALVEYARRGGTVLLTGVATLFDEQGRQQADFALAEPMGLHFQSILQAAQPGRAPRVFSWMRAALPRSLDDLALIQTEPVAGVTLAWFTSQGGRWPLVHVRPLGQGRIAYLATNGSPTLTAAVIDSFCGSPVITTPASKRAFLTRQEAQHRWILHLMGDGAYTIDIQKSFALLTKIVRQYPAGGWSAELQTTDSAVRIQVRGSANDRLLVLQ